MKTPKKFKWKVTVEISVAPIWVADGYYPDPERIAEELRLNHATSSEMGIKAKVVEGPSKKDIDKWLSETTDF